VAVTGHVDDAGQGFEGTYMAASMMVVGFTVA
jgi:hypothetical protein